MEEVNTSADLSDFDGPQGACIACLYEDELDADGLCAGCNPVNEETRVALINLLKPTSNEVKTSENN
jgi:hypothetical protein